MMVVQSGIPLALARRHRKQLLRELDAGERKRHTRTMATLRKGVKDAKRARREGLKGAKLRCHDNRKKAEAAAKLAYDKAKEAAKEAARKATAARIAAKKAAKQVVLDHCELDRKHVEAEATAKIVAAEKERDENARHARELAAIKRSNKSRAKEKKPVTAAQRRQESDDAVEAELPEALIPLWHKVRSKGIIKPSNFQSRAEAFLQYAAELPDEVLQAQQEIADRELAKMEREYRAQMKPAAAKGKALRKTKAPAPKKKAAGDDRIPF